MSHSSTNDYLYPLPLANPVMNFETLNNDVIADGIQYVVLQATVIDAITGRPVPSALITFSVNRNAFFISNGLPETFAYTDIYGIAIVAVANNLVGDVTVTANHAGHSAIAFANFIEARGYEIVFDDPSPPVLANFSDIYPLTGRVLYNGQPVIGYDVDFFFTDPLGRLGAIGNYSNNLNGTFRYNWRSYIPGVHQVFVRVTLSDSTVFDSPPQPVEFLDRRPDSEYKIVFYVERTNGLNSLGSRMVLSIRHVATNRPPAIDFNTLRIDQFYPNAHHVQDVVVSAAPSSLPLPPEFDQRASFQITWVEDPSVVLIYYNAI